ncbi:MAG: hypothetical protein JXR37_26240 [Kiritimatiellae bacterium]|nr:hypothetical protein [Kiritimatiellia bacterium]
MTKDGILWFIVLAVIIPLATSGEKTGDPLTNSAANRAEALCKRLASDPPNTNLLASLKSVMFDAEPRDAQPRYIAAYSLGELLAGDSEEARVGRDYLAKSFPFSEFIKFLTMDTLGGPCPDCDGRGVTHQTCTLCKGSGKCANCGGSGRIRHHFSGDVRRCGMCSGSGKCRNCGGSGRISNSCAHCCGTGTIMSVPRARQVYLCILRGENIPPVNNKAAVDSRHATDAPGRRSNRIFAHDVAIAYSENEIAADEKYLNKVVTVVGIAMKIGKNLGGGAYVLVGRGEYYLYCSFGDSQKKHVAKLKIWDKEVIVQGTCKGKGLLGQVYLEDCVFQSY